MASKTKKEIKAELRAEIMDELSPAMDSMAMATTARTNSVDKNEAALNAMNSKVDALISQNKRLNSELDRIKSKDGGGKRVKFKRDQDGTGGENELNSKGVLCATKKGSKRWTKSFTYFVEPQWCEHCKEEAYHPPRYCPTLPENKKRKRESEERREAKRSR